MSDQHNVELPQSRVKKRSKTLSFLVVVIVILLATGVYLFVQKNPFSSGSTDVKSSDAISVPQQPEQGSPPATAPETESAKSQQDQNPNSTEESLPLSETSADMGNQNISDEGNLAENTAPPTSGNTSDQASIELPSADNPQLLVDEINSFYAHVDEQPYMTIFGLKESSKAHFSKLLQKLVDNPPVVIRETDDLFTLLQNTAHFFRILGKKNINILKAMLNNEKDSVEIILNSFYNLTSQPELLKKEYSISIPAHALTDYAGFFLNTMGGRMYLFRRDSTSRMVVSYYSIIIIDRANNNGEGGNGIDLRPAIRSLIDDIEIGGSRLQFRNEYLKKLYNLEEKYN